MRAAIQAFIERHRLLEPGQRVLVGLSGGLDSVVLLHVLHALGYTVSAAHVNYRLRGAEADAAEAFAKELCNTLSVPLTSWRVPPGRWTGENRQAEARALRYAYLADRAEALGAPAVAVAHHRDDQVETVLLRLARGVGRKDALGMAPQRSLQDDSAAVLVRPLLGQPRARLQAYAEAHSLMWRDDATNASSRYARNRIRHLVLPALEAALGDEALAGIARSATLLASTDAATIDAHTLIRAALASQGVQAIDHEVLGALPPVWQRRLVLAALAVWAPEAERSLRTATRIVDLLHAEAGARYASGALVVWRTRRGLAFQVTSKPSSPEFAEAPLLPGSSVLTPIGSVQCDSLRVPPEHLDAGRHVAYVDEARVAGPLVVRAWKPGDRLVPLGMDGHQTVAEVLTACQTPVHQRRHVPVVASGDAVVWVVGARLSELFKVRLETERVMKFTLIPD